MPGHDAFADDFKLSPFWWGGRGEVPCADASALPASVDVVVVGAGVTGVEAARVLAEHGRDVLVLDAGRPGEGASSRNAGQIGRNFKHPYSALKLTYGPEVARGFFDELQQAYDAVRDLGAAHPNAFDWREGGRVIGAMSPVLFDKLCREYELRARELGEVVEVLDRDAMRAELGSNLYHGGIRLPRNGAIQPARFHELLLRRALAAGARVLGHTAVRAVERGNGGFVVRTRDGAVRCRQVLVATNGYTDAALPAIRARLVPITSYMIATEPLSPNQMATALPALRTYHDNRRRSHFFSVSPDGRRVLMGGRTGTFTTDARGLARRLHGDLAFILPSIADVKLTHFWQGRCAAPVDLFPRFGEIDGLHYALGYTFSGMAMGPHLARKVAARMLEDERGSGSLFARPSFPKVPLPARGPWTMPAITGWYAWADRPKTLRRRL